MSDESDLMSFVKLLEKLPERKIYVKIVSPKEMGSGKHGSEQ